jgi:Fe-S cluster biosynthesis and repair protein YggX
MANNVHCVKLGREAEALDKAPLKGEVGEKIFANVSKDGWKMWLEHSKMLINEYRMDLTSEQGQKIWYAEMDKFFFGDGSSAPPDFVKKDGAH